MDNKGQLSVEVLFLFAISIVVLIVFTIPLGHLAISNTLDIVNVLNAEAEINQLANGVDMVYCQGAGAKRVETIELNKDLTVFVKPKYLSGDIVFGDGNIKRISENHKATNVFSNLYLSRGINKVLISWEEDSSNIIMKKIWLLLLFTNNIYIF